jgi:DNA-binding response OmpR family regulator
MKRRILLVDDDIPILLTLKAILELNGFEVDTASSAREGMQKLENNTYSMVITDMRMEKDTAGYDVIRFARQQAYNPATSVLTAYPDLGTEWKSKGAQSLLVKPINTGDLLRQIEALLVVHEDAKQRQAAAAQKLPKTASAEAKKTG